MRSTTECDRARGRRRSPSPRCRRGRSTPAPARRPRSAVPRRAHRPHRCGRSNPPPAPTVCTSSDGSRIGNPPTRRPGAGSGTAPRTRQTSVDVPPMSNVIASGASLAAAIAAAASTPPAGPDNNSAAGSAAASVNGTSPPAEVITSTSRARGASRSRYARHAGRRYALTTVVRVRSYSRNSGDTSTEHVTSKSRDASDSANRRSDDGSRSLCMRQIAMASTSGGNDRVLPASNRNERGTSGSGRSAQRSYNDGRSCRPISITSVKPPVVTSATRAPVRSSKAFVATVVPCASTSGLGPRRPIADPTASAGSSGVEGTLALRPSSATASVKVPPVSTPTRTQGT